MELDGGVRAAEHKIRVELSRWPALDAGNIHGFRLKLKELRSLLQLERDADASMLRALGNAKKKIGDWHDWQQLKEIAREILDAQQDRVLLTEIDQAEMRKTGRGPGVGQYAAQKVSAAGSDSQESGLEQARNTPPAHAAPDGRTSERNSARVSFCLKQPSMALVTVEECCFSMPRIIMHRWRASITTPTPCGAIAS